MAPVGVIFARLDKREKRLNAHKTGKRGKIGQTCNRSFERWEESNLKRQKPPALPAKSRASVKKFKQTITKALLHEGKRANMGKTDPEKAIASRGKKGEQTGNE